jgi:hypothetical protein
MKAKIVFLLAAFLMLFSVSANAQSGGTPIKGDANEDGVVDIADINAIIDIMKNGGGTGGETKYYWYVGVISPTDPNNPDENTGNNKWTLLTSEPSSISVNTDMEVPPAVWYIAIPHIYGFQAYDSTGAAPDVAAYTKSLITISGVQYDLFTGNNKAIAVNGVFKK